MKKKQEKSKVAVIASKGLNENMLFYSTFVQVVVVVVIVIKKPSKKLLKIMHTS